MSDLDTSIARAVMKSFLDEQENEAQNTRPPEIEARRIIDLYADLNEMHKFKPGDLVSWKRGLKNGKYPAKDFPAIVTKIYEQPLLRDDTESGSNHFREPLDLVILVDTGDEVSEFHVDSRRFKPYKGPIEGGGTGA